MPDHQGLFESFVGAGEIIFQALADCLVGIVVASLEPLEKSFETLFTDTVHVTERDPLVGVIDKIPGLWHVILHQTFGSHYVSVFIANITQFMVPSVHRI